MTDINSIIRGAGGDAIKSIQQGTAAIPSNAIASFLNIAINSVDANYTAVLIDCQGYDCRGKFAGQIASPTILQLVRNTAYFNNYISWTVIEFDPARVKSFTKGNTGGIGSTGNDGGTISLPVPNVDLTKTLALFNAYQWPDAPASLNYYRECINSLSSTAIVLRGGGYYTYSYFYYFFVELL